MFKKVSILAIFLFLTTSLLGCGSSNDPIPLNQDALGKLESKIDLAKITSIGASCEGQDDKACMIKLAKEIDRTFSSAGYSLDKSINQCYSSQENAIYCSQSGLAELFLIVFSLLDTQQGTDLLIKEELISKETIATIEKMK